MLSPSGNVVPPCEKLAEVETTDGTHCQTAVFPASAGDHPCLIQLKWQHYVFHLHGWCRVIVKQEILLHPELRLGVVRHYQLQRLLSRFSNN